MPCFALHTLTLCRMQLIDFAPEIILAIFQNCSSIADVTNLSRSCRLIHSLLSTSQKTLILFRAAESQFGPLHDIFQVLTLNNSQPAHSIRDSPRSDWVLRQVVRLGRVANRWEEIYPLVKWDSDFADRRLLTVDERYRLRRAIYRYWLYAHAFHSPAYPRTSRRYPQVVFQRTSLLYNWSARELLEINDFQSVTRALMSTKICPSDSMVQTMCYLDGVYFSVRPAKQPVTLAAQDYFHTTRETCSGDKNGLWNFDLSHGWGDPVTHYYVIEDLLKLDPESVLWLYDHSQKRQVENYLASLGEWFCNNGETFSETLICVMERRELDQLDQKSDSHFGIINEDCWNVRKEMLLAGKTG